MDYIIVGGICLMIGCIIGVWLVAILGANGADTEEKAE